MGAPSKRTVGKQVRLLWIRVLIMSKAQILFPFVLIQKGEKIKADKN